jgi:hypothetical protein
MTDITKLNITAIAASDKEPGVYALYGKNQLFISRINTGENRLIAKLPNLQSHGTGDSRFEGKELEITIHYHHHYICVTERFGVNGALVNLETGSIRELIREDYHCDVSSYSIGFLEHDGKTLIICQTAWNRLDIIDAETGRCLTEREVYRRKTEEKDKNGFILYDDKNYLDYFHSRLHISPDSNYFLSNGWVWSPFDTITIFNIRDFFKTFEPGAIMIDLENNTSGYNWDRPCCFVDNETIAVILDDAKKTGGLDPGEEKNYEYNQLAFFKITDEYIKKHEHRYTYIIPEKTVKCVAFDADNEYGEVRGLLYFDQYKGYLVAVTPGGSSAVSLSGEILAQVPEAVFTKTTFNYVDNITIGWDYTPEHHVLYSWQKGIGIVEKQF